MIKDIRASTGCGIRRICASLEVPRSSFYHAARPTATQSQDRRIGGLIEAIFARHRRRYGYRRIGEELSDQGWSVPPDRLRRITFIPTSRGWLYLAVIIDLCSRKIVGWSLVGHLRTPLVVDALKQALGSRRALPNLIFHNDRGKPIRQGHLPATAA